MVDVTIAIASCGRPTLLDALASVETLQLPPGVTVEIIVADDDPSSAATRLVNAREPGKLPLRCIRVAARNIAHARNACIDAARGPLLAFIDDDEWVAPEWLARLLAAREEFGAQCVFGPVFPQYPEGTPGWLVRANPLYVDWGKRGRRVETGRSGNALIDLEFVHRHGLRFDPALGRSGGEDTQFFAALHAKGGRLVATDDAPVFEHVPAERLDPAYLRGRSLRSGQSFARIMLGDGGSVAGRVQFALDAGAKMAVAFTAAAALRPMDRAVALRFAIKGWMNLGKLREVAGLALATMY